MLRKICDDERLTWSATTTIEINNNNSIGTFSELQACIHKFELIKMFSSCKLRLYFYCVRLFLNLFSRIRFLFQFCSEFFLFQFQVILVENFTKFRPMWNDVMRIKLACLVGLFTIQFKIELYNIN